MFSTLAARVPGAVVLDLFAGSGALGIEALSRGAASATFVERDRAVADVLRANLAALDLAAHVYVAAADRFVAGLAHARPEAPFDLVLCDPPYHMATSELASLLGDLVRGGHVAAGAIMVVERDRHDIGFAGPSGVLDVTDARTYGDTVLYYVQAGSGGGQEAVLEQEAVLQERRTGPGGAGVSTSAVCPGTFDPVTNGHVDVIERAAVHFDRLLVACLRNVGKRPLFELDRRVELLEAATQHLDNVEIATFEGLLVDFCRQHHVRIVVRGLRAVSDFESELEMAQMNHRLADVETFFVATSPLHSFLSSTLVKEVARFGGDVSPFVPAAVNDSLRAKYASKGNADE
jgi:pantetheine-phosphate adenylyltransferase